MADIPCAVCLTQFSQYTCPRCGIRYCSLSCYRRHGDRTCHQQFLQQQLMERLRTKSSDAVSESDRRIVIEMLHRMEAEQQQQQQREESGGTQRDGSGDDGGWRDAWERLWQRVIDHTSGDDAHGGGSGGNVEDMIVDVLLRELERDDALKRDFEASVRDGRMSRWAQRELWRPWWTEEGAAAGGGRRLVQERRQQQQQQEVEEHHCASGDGNDDCALPPLSKLLGKRRAAGTVPYDVLDVLYGYCYVMRLFNGDVAELLRDRKVVDSLKGESKGAELGKAQPVIEEYRAQFIDTASALYRLSQYVLEAPEGKGRGPLSHQNMASVVQNAMERSAANWDLFDSWSYSQSVLGDVMCLMEDTQMVQRALTHVQVIFSTSSSILSRTSSRGRHGDAKWRQKFFVASHKLYFYRVWCNSQPCDIFLLFKEGWRALAEERREMIALWDNKQRYDDNHQHDAAALNILHLRKRCTRPNAPQNLGIATDTGEEDSNKRTAHPPVHDRSKKSETKCLIEEIT